MPRRYKHFRNDAAGIPIPYKPLKTRVVWYGADGKIHDVHFPSEAAAKARYDELVVSGERFTVSPMWISA